jgi:hypothetical protein
MMVNNPRLLEQVRDDIRARHMSIEREIFQSGYRGLGASHLRCSTCPFLWDKSIPPNA